jgi:hypothetical protein
MVNTSVEVGGGEERDDRDAGGVPGLGGVSDGCGVGLDPGESLPKEGPSAFEARSERRHSNKLASEAAPWKGWNEFGTGINTLRV